MLPFHGIKNSKQPHLNMRDPSSHKSCIVIKWLKRMPWSFFHWGKANLLSYRKRKQEVAQVFAVGWNNMDIAWKIIPVLMRLVLFCSVQTFLECLNPQPHLCWCDGVHILRGEALQQGGLSSVVQPQQHYPDLLLCGSLQLLDDRE